MILQAHQLTKTYGNTVALAGLDLEVPAGEVFCLLGPNGAGKTTTINLFLGFITPSSGQVRVGGADPATDPLGARRSLAYIPETVMLYANLSGVENLGYFATLATGREFSRTELEALLTQAGLQSDAFGQRVSGYSKGMRQKVGIAIALAKNASALLLDEPTSGLDPRASNEFSRLVSRLAGDGMAVLMVTHDLFLAQQCGTRIGIMQRGRLQTVLEARETDLNRLEATYLELSAEEMAA